ncbi:MAG TPA: hypothetical protein VNQ57_11985 [Ureibacillus sp.]|nr:hypothetical protein [Ureibacillus sp.]
MKTKSSLTFLKGAIITSLFIGVSLIVGGYSVLAAGLHRQGPGGMVPGGHHELYGPQHGGFSWLGFVLLIMLGIAAVLLFKKFNQKSKSSSMEQFIQTTLTSSYQPVNSQKEHILDQWEKEINKKENI